MAPKPHKWYLGKAERQVLEALQKAQWRNGMGNLSGNMQQTIRVLENLCKKGYVSKAEDKRPHQLLGDSVYTITQTGINKLAEVEA